MDDFTYKWDLDTWLHTIIDHYESARAEYWSKRLAEEDWTPLNELRQGVRATARMILTRAKTLRNIGDIGELNQIFSAWKHEEDLKREQIDRMIAKVPREYGPEVAADLRTDLETSFKIFPENAEDRPLRLIWEELCILDARDHADEVRDRVARVFQLERVIRGCTAQNTSAAASEFLCLVSRCFIAGYFPECIAFCRSAIDTAFRGKVSDVVCSQRGDSPRSGYQLSNRIEAALPNLIDKGTYDAAIRVRERGNTVIHNDANAVRDFIGTIKDTLLVLQALERHPDISEP